MRRTPFIAVAAIGLVIAGLAPKAPLAQDGVTVGGFIEMVAGTSDHDGGVDGFSRGFYSRFSVAYDTVLDNGLEVAGRAAFQLNQRGSGTTFNPATGRTSSGDSRMDASTNYDPDVLYISVGGGFGTVSVGAHAPATCSMIPRPIAFLGGVDLTYYELFSGVELTNATFSENGYCDTPESVSYATPEINGFGAMLTFAPDTESNQGTTLRNAQTLEELGNVEDRFDVAAAWSGAMGAVNLSLGAGYQTAANDALESFTVAGELGFGGFSIGAAWFENDDGPSEYEGVSVDRIDAVELVDEADLASDLDESTIDALVAEGDFGAADWRGEQDGWSIAGKYDIGALSFGVTYSQAQRDNHDVGADSFSIETEGPDANTAPTPGNNVTTQIFTGLASDVDESALVLGASYAIGGGLTAWIEWMDIEQEYTSARYMRVVTTDDSVGANVGMIEDDDVDAAAATALPSERTTNDDSLFMVGVSLGF